MARKKIARAQTKRKTNAKKISELLLSQSREILAEEQTVLSRERTIQAFMQTGIAFIGVGLVVINVFKESSGFVVLGGILVLIGLAEILEAFRKLRVQKRIMKRVKSKEREMNLFR
jgi:uncharacterized membrane protein YidH (DUF202 family)